MAPRPDQAMFQAGTPPFDCRAGRRWGRQAQRSKHNPEERITIQGLSPARLPTIVGGYLSEVFYAVVHREPRLRFPGAFDDELQWWTRHRHPSEGEPSTYIPDGYLKARNTVLIWQQRHEHSFVQDFCAILLCLLHLGSSGIFANNQMSGLLCHEAGSGSA